MKNTMVSMKEKLGFMTFSTSSNIVFNFKNIYYLIFLTNVLKIPVLTAGTILTLGTVWDAVNDPLIGIFSANHTFRNGEKVRPYALWCAVPWAVAIVLMFSDFKTSQTLTVILCIVIYFVFEALYTFLGMPYNSMGSLSSSLDSDRKSINACIAGCLAHYFTTKERVKQSSDDESRISLLQAYKMLFSCRSWVLNMFYIICYGITTALIMNNINYYAAYIMGASSKATPILAVYLVVAIITSILTPMVDSRIGRKNTMLLGAVLQLLGKIPFIINPYSVANIYINALSVGLGSTITFVMFNTNRNNIADMVEWKNGRRIDSMVAAGDNLASKLAEAGAVQLMAFALARAGFDEALKMNQTPATLSTICALLGWAPLVVSIIMLIVLLKMDINKEMEESRPVTQ